MKANVVDDITKDVSNIELTVVICNVNLVGSNPKEWWIDIGTTHHVCLDKKILSTFERIETREKVYMGNFVASKSKAKEMWS